MYMAIRAVLSLCASMTGFVADADDGMSLPVPIYEDHALPLFGMTDRDIT